MRGWHYIGGKTGKLGNVLDKQRNLEDKKRFEDVKQLVCARFIC